MAGKEITKEFPNFVKLEENVLGNLLSSGAFASISALFEPEYFYFEIHKIIAEKIKALWSVNKPINIYTIADYIGKDTKAMKYFVEIKPLDYMSLLPSGYIDIKYSLLLLIEKWMLRKQIMVGSELSDKGFNQEDPFDTNEWAIEELHKIDIRDKIEGNFENYMDSVLTKIKKIKEEKIYDYLKTGNVYVDRFLQLEPRRIILLAGAKKQGKTKFILSLINDLFENNNNINVCWNSFEMNEEDLIMEIISKKTEIIVKNLKGVEYNLSDNDYEYVHNVGTIIRKWNIHFNTVNSSIKFIKNHFRRNIKKDHTNVLLIDNLGSIHPDRIMPPTESDDFIMKELVTLRDQTNALIILVHHLSKEVSGKDNRQYAYSPNINHVRGSSRILDYCNIGLLIHYPNQYKDLIRDKNKQLPGMKDITRKLFIVDKAINRHGESEKIRFLCDLNINKFEHIEKIEVIKQ